MCHVTGEMSSDLLGDFCMRIAESQVSAATTTEIIERCADCVALGDVERTSSNVSVCHFLLVNMHCLYLKTCRDLEIKSYIHWE